MPLSKSDALPLSRRNERSPKKGIDTHFYTILSFKLHRRNERSLKKGIDIL